MLLLRVITISFSIHFFEFCLLNVDSWTFVKSCHFLPHDCDNTFLASMLSLFIDCGLSDSVANGSSNFKNIGNLLHELFELVDGSNDSDHIEEKLPLIFRKPNVIRIVRLSPCAIFLIFLSLFFSVRIVLWWRFCGFEILGTVHLRGRFGRNGCLEWQLRPVVLLNISRLKVELVLGVHIVLGPDIFHPLRHFTLILIRNLFLKLVNLNDEFRPFS